ncbi:MAG: dienelactone hydrolase family protein [Polyangiaceae bacterium]|jgi:carboxymethylenebutenolidase|nr:dienelactone hydrolase family protein [Polyangiaceae bacterium]MBK8942744.1 dienelactone hydrolase family protein [Polyangiaceae bacterium]
MNDLERYLAEEIALEVRDGHLTRREALRRLSLMGLGAAASTALLSACGAPNEPAEPSTTSAGPAVSPPSASASPPAASAAPSASAPPAALPPPELPPSLPTTAITWKGPSGTLQGAWAAPEKPKGGVLVIHENKGLNDHTRHVAGRFAHVGYAALAIDLLSTEGGTASFADPAEATAALGKAPPERHVAELRSALDEIAKRAPKVKLAAIGFCFGGAMTWRLVASKDARLAAAAPFYGPFPDGADVSGAKSAVLGVFAEDDERVNKTRDAAKAALEKAKLVHEIVTYPGQHAFFNDARERYHAGSSKAAWEKVLAWFGKHVG